MIPCAPRIPVTLLTRVPGAGKTTLPNHLRRSPGPGRVADILKDFGDIGPDHDLIERATEDMVLLQSGCLCGSIRGDLVTTLGNVARRRANRQIGDGRVAIKTAGVAAPPRSGTGRRRTAR